MDGKTIVVAFFAVFKPGNADKISKHTKNNNKRYNFVVCIQKRGMCVFCMFFFAIK